MKKRINEKWFCAAFIIVCFLLITAGFGFAQEKTSGALEKQEKVKLPKLMTWTAYDMGSNGYVQASAVGNALNKNYNLKLRVIPAGTDISRYTPLREKRVDFSLSGLGAWLAWRGIFDFSSLEWGPQKYRVVWQTAGNCGLATAKEANIKSLADMKGKRVPHMPGNPTFDLIHKSFLAFANLTEKDIVTVSFPSYGKSQKGLIDNQADCIFSTVEVPTMYELASSPRGIYWPEFPSADKEGWARLHKYAPFIGPRIIGEGAGMIPGKTKPRELAVYPYPVLIANENQDENLVYNLAKAIHESYGLYKSVSVAMPGWELKKAFSVPLYFPVHPGTVRFLKEIGAWTPALGKRNNELLAEEKTRIKKWNEFKEQAVKQKLSADEIRNSWHKLELGF